MGLTQREKDVRRRKRAIGIRVDAAVRESLQTIAVIESTSVNQLLLAASELIAGIDDSTTEEHSRVAVRRRLRRQLKKVV